jgi:hypothetical protein
LRDLYGISHAVGMFFRIPAVAPIVILAAVCTVRAAPSRYKRGFDLEGLIREQAASFPVTAAYVGRALRLVPPSDNVRPADYALTPDEWLQRFAFDRHGQFDAVRAASALAGQLSARWSGPKAAAPAARFLFVVFGLHLAQHREQALALLGAASAALGSISDDAEFGPRCPLQLPDPLVAKTDALITDPAAFEVASTVAAGHAYTATALMALLNAARTRVHAPNARQTCIEGCKVLLR